MLMDTFIDKTRNLRVNFALGSWNAENHVNHINDEQPVKPKFKRTIQTNVQTKTQRRHTLVSFKKWPRMTKSEYTHTQLES